jgi:hypothetical protein
MQALERGGHVSTRDVARRMPPLAGNLWMGGKAQPLLDPLARHSLACALAYWAVRNIHQRFTSRYIQTGVEKSFSLHHGCCVFPS